MEDESLVSRYLSLYIYESGIPPDGGIIPPKAFGEKESRASCPRQISLRLKHKVSYLFDYMENNYPKVGVGVMVMKEGKVLLHKRKGLHGDGEYAWPGGHLEYMESFENCVKREVIEEAGIEIQNVRFLRLMNLKKYAPKHYVDIGLICEWKSGEPKLWSQKSVRDGTGMIWIICLSRFFSLFLPTLRHIKQEKIILMRNVLKK